jgi:hypothetical protein
MKTCIIWGIMFLDILTQNLDPGHYLTFRRSALHMAEMIQQKAIDNGLWVVSAPMQVTNLTPLCQKGLDRSRPGNDKEYSSSIAFAAVNILQKS